MERKIEFSWYGIKEVKKFGFKTKYFFNADLEDMILSTVQKGRKENHTDSFGNLEVYGIEISQDMFELINNRYGIKTL